MDEQTREKALETLDNMAALITTDKVLAETGSYFAGAADWLDEHDDATIPITCTGDSVCLMGAAWVGHGDACVSAEHEAAGLRDTAELVGIFPSEREAYLAERPALRLVYDTLNAEAEALHLERPDARVAPGFLDPPDGGLASYAEALFEGDGLTRDDLLALLARCHKAIAGGVLVG